MDKQQANQLLDKLRDGKQFTFEEISAALFATGDLHDPMRGERMEEPLQSESQRDWQTERTELVGRNESGNSSSAWPGWSRYLNYRNEQEVK